MTKRKAGRPFGTFKSAWPARINGKETPGHRRWSGMKGRCYNKNSHIWKYYGGRGITVCERWLGKDGFEHFMDDMGEPPVGMTLDRVNNMAGYSKENCRWATWKDQASNRRAAPVKTDPKSLRQMAIKAGLPYSAVYQRYKLLGWTLEQALTTPHLGRGKPPGGWPVRA
jgi:hypothetical protein